MPATGWAQGAIGGVVRDTSGGLLPGVSVEASSDVLIEKVRSTVSDDSGQYLIVGLRPGTYKVTFSLSGFRTLSREGLELSAGVTLPINAQMEIGALEETLTVTGETPVVDVSSTQQQTVLNRELLDAMPRARSSTLTGRYLPGVTGGNSGAGQSSGAAVNGAGTLGVHGGRTGDMTTSVDGLWLHDFSGGGGQNELMPSDAGVQEYTYETSGMSAETMSGGIRINIVPKEGGNSFSGTAHINGSGGALTSSNLSDSLKTQGLTEADLDRLWDFNGGVGGPILRDRLWFFGTYRHWGLYTYPAGGISEANPNEPFRAEERYGSAGLRMTWQATPRNKINFYAEDDIRDLYTQDLSATVTAEASRWQHYPTLWLAQLKWTSPVTNRMLLEAGVNRHKNEIDYLQSALSERGAYPVMDVSTGMLSGTNSQRQLNPNELWLVSAAASYITGSHAFKAGLTHSSGHRYRHFLDVPPLLRMQNGVPFQVRFEAIPAVTRPQLNHDLGIYAQDKWVVKRMTLNLGLRFDYLNSQINEQDAPAGRFVPARHFDPIYNVPNWKDISPRLGVAYDLFGDARTAIKTSLNRYVVFEAINFAQMVNPLTQGAGSSAGASDTRTWNDLNGDRIPQDNELGPSTNLNFGKPILDVRADPKIAEGWGVREYNWEFSASVQHQVVPGLSASVAYFRRWYGNQLWTDNTLLNETDYITLTIANPLDATERITLYNLNPAKRGLAERVLTFAPDNGQVYDGFEFLVNGRFADGGLVSGSMTIGETTVDTCTVDDPNQLRFCRNTAPFMAEAIYKAMVSYRLPLGIQASGVFQSVPGPKIAANYTVTSAIAGVSLTNGSILVNLVEPGSLYGDRSNEVNIRLARRFAARRTTVEPSVEVFNIANASPVRTVNVTYGPNWQRPTSTPLGRMLKLALKVDF
jgi:hypothetical protein